jgi:hypothetical protein
MGLHGLLQRQFYFLQHLETCHEYAYYSILKMEAMKRRLAFGPHRDISQKMERFITTVVSASNPVLAWMLRDQGNTSSAVEYQLIPAI